jgi:hypothetical protein
MSSSIWTRSGRRTSRLRGRPWRAVEAQHLVSTRKLVDSDAEQAVLEELLERSKPPLPSKVKLHFLLATPFRYPPLPYGSRFGTRSQRGIFYASDTVDTALAEVAYYRLLFLEQTTASLVPITFHWSLFQTHIDTARGVDLTRPPFDGHRARISSKSDYGVSERLGQDMREANVEACRYFSARAGGDAANVAVFDPAAFARRTPLRQERWYCAVTEHDVVFTRDDLLAKRTRTFPRASFLENGRLPRAGI